MKRMMLPGLMGLTLLLVLGPVAPARALMIAPNPVPLRVAAADVVVVGKVTGFGPKLVKAEMFKGDTRDMQVATLEVSDTITGKKVKEIKVGFFPPAMAPMGGLRPIIRRYPSVQLTIGQEAMLFLTRHPTQKDVYVAQMYFDAINKKDNPNFAKELAEAKSAAKLLADPMTGLKSKDAEERWQATALLITRYRTGRQGATRTEAVPAEQSKLILTNLAEADWSNSKPRNFQMNPQGMFYRLGVTAKDGWTQPKEFTRFPEEAKKWLKDNADKFRLQRFVLAGEVGAEPDK